MPRQKALRSGKVDRSAGVLAALGLLGLAGCATAPRSAPPDVQRRLASTAGLAVTLPTTDAERSTADAAVNRLLADNLTPDAAVRIAVVNNRGLRANLDELGVSEADLLQAGLLRNPTFFADARFPNRAPHPADVELSLAGNILDDVLIPVRKKVARAQLESAEDKVTQSVLDLAAQVKAAAYTLEARQEFRERLAAIDRANAAAADLARRQFAAGNISPLDLATQRVAAEESHLEFLRTDARIQADREALNRLMGLSAGQTGWAMKGELPALPASDPGVPQLEQAASYTRFDLAAARTQVALARTAYRLVRNTRFLPAGATLGVDSERNPDGSRVTGPSVELGLPIFDQGQAKLARAAADVRRAQDAYEALAANIGSEVRQAANALAAARTAAAYYQITLLPERERIVRQTLLYYNAMQSSTYDLLLAKEADESAEREGIGALRDYWIARVELERAVGGRLP